MKLLWGVALLFVFVVGPVTAQVSIRDRVSDIPFGGDLSLTVSPMHPSMDVPALLPLTDVVVEGVVKSAASAITDDEASVATTYEVEVRQVMFSRRGATVTPQPSVSTVRVRGVGGEVNVDGRIVRAIDSSLRPFQVGAHLILFLKEDSSQAGLYQIVDGPYGTFGVAGDRITSHTVTIDQRVGELYEDTEVNLFKSLIQQGSAAIP